MKQILLIALAMIAIIGCSKNEDKSDAGSENNPDIPFNIVPKVPIKKQTIYDNHSHYQKIVLTKDNNNNQVSEFYKNGQLEHRFIEMYSIKKEGKGAIYTSITKEGDKITEKEVSVFEEGKLVKKTEEYFEGNIQLSGVTHFNESVTTYFNYENNKLISMKKITSLKTVIEYHFSYRNNDEMSIEGISYSINEKGQEEPNTRHIKPKEIFYLSNDNLIKHIAKQGVLVETTVYTYDNKNNFAHDETYLISDPILRFMADFSKNNVLTEETTRTNGQYTEIRKNRSEYEYNDKGYVTKRSEYNEGENTPFYVVEYEYQ
ncbi:hypothetical protein [Capnocytophaga gingivalis]